MPFVGGQPIKKKSFFSFSFWNNKHTNVILIKIFENAQKSVINRQKRPKWRFWRSITFFCAFSKIPTKRTFVRLLFLKLNQGRNTKKIFWGGFLQNQKCTFLGVQNGTFKKSIFKFVFLRLFFNVKGSFMPIFTKKY